MVSYLDHRQCTRTPNIVVDGSPNDATEIVLTHWPGIAQPSGMAADLSAEMAFRFVRTNASSSAEVITNNHFDQDGLVSMAPFVLGEQALEHEALLIDVAAAGDFALFRDRRAARASMTLAAYADPERSPIAAALAGTYDDQCVVLYESLLPTLVEMATDPSPYRELWGEEDAELARCEHALATGAVSIEEMVELDLAIVRIDAGVEVARAHRFAADVQVGFHPMAVYPHTDRFRVLEIQGRRYCYTDRYETWVQYRSRRPLPRVDLRPLAHELESIDADAGWSASSPSGLIPRLENAHGSRIAPREFVAMLRRHLSNAAVAWEPYR
ncbi:MAG: DUF6687 family protein [Actinomycetota bacterium]